MCRKLYYPPLCTHYRPMMRETPLPHHRSAMCAESFIFYLSACIAGLWRGRIFFLVIGMQCVQKALLSTSLHAYDEENILPHHRHAMCAESIIIYLSARIACLWWRRIFFPIIGMQCVQKALLSTSLHAVHAYDEEEESPLS